MLTQKRLKELLNYDPETGIFVWKVSVSNVKVGDIAGTDCNGYVSIRADSKLYLAHRLAWLYEYGYFPENFLDHEDRNKSNNRSANLREVSNQCNARNTGNRKDNTSGVKGICFDKAAQKWVAKIYLDSGCYHLGYFTDFTEAVATRVAAEQCLNWSNCDSSSPAYRHMQKKESMNTEKHIRSKMKMTQYETIKK